MDEKLEQECRCYMKDCGLSPEQAEVYLSLAEKGCTGDQIILLKLRRREVMEQLHTASRQVSCIDFVIHELEQGKTACEKLNADN